MRKDIKKRLERALMTMEEPGGSSIQSIMRIVNKEFPAMSLRKILEALQEGINEGVLCVYNGRFKLKKQMNWGKDAFDIVDSGRRRGEARHPEAMDEDQERGTDEEEDAVNPRKLADGRARSVENKRMKSRQDSYSPKRERSPKKRRPKKYVKGRSNRMRGDEVMSLEMPSKSPEKKSSKPTTEKPELKKQRGPRCTSMKKDVRMPSKVHIPFVLPPVPQRSNNFNDLLRRSPEPVNGPLFDNFAIAPGDLESFGIQY